MKFCAAYRSVLETISILFLTLTLDDHSFAALITDFYPIYFIANLVFSSSTVDFAGGNRQPQLTTAILILALPAALPFAMIQDRSFHSFYFILAGLTALESVVFVFCESSYKSIILVLLLIPRALFALCIVLIFVVGEQLSLEATIWILFARDLTLVLIGAIVLFVLRRELIFRVGSHALKVDEIIYLLTSNCQDFVLRIVVNHMLGAAFVKEFEYALRLPRVAQVGLMLAFRYKIFTNTVPSNDQGLTLRLHVFAAICSLAIIFANLVEFSTDTSLILVCAILATTAVPWYTEKLRGRKFFILTFAQLLSFAATLVAATAFSDAYISVVSMTLVLFIFSFGDKLSSKLT